MLEKPDDLDVAFDYAALSTQLGDLESAIATLERMLVFAPGLPRLQLELGVLYYRLAAFETARSYFEQAVSGPNVPEEVRSKVNEYLAQIDEAGKTTRFFGQVRAGIRYQTNANRVTTDGTVLLNGLPFILDPGARGGPDGNVYGSGFVHVSHDLPSQGDTIEADLVVYGSKQFHFDELDTTVAELTAGPAFDLGRLGIENAAVGIYGIGSFQTLEEHYYAGAAGVGTRLVLMPAPGFSVITSVEYRSWNYDPSSVAPAANLRDGDEVRAYARALYAINPVLTFSATAYVQQTDAESGFAAYDEAGFAASVSWAFDAPIPFGAGPWVLSPNAGMLHREFDGPDPVINVAEAETDTHVFVGADLLVPLKDDWGLLAETAYLNANSNYPTAKFDDFSISLSIVKSF